MTADDIFKERLDPQQKYFSKKSSKNKQLFYFFKVSALIIALTIPFLVGFTSDFGTPAKVITGALSVLAAIFTGIESIFLHQQKWVNFRMTSELLKQEKFLYRASAGPYLSDQSVALLATRVEAIISSQNSDWKLIAEHNADKDKPGQ